MNGKLTIEVWYDASKPDRVSWTAKILVHDVLAHGPDRETAISQVLEKAGFNGLPTGQGDYKIVNG